MDTDWQEFLLSQGALGDATGVLDFPAEAGATTHLHDLSRLGLIVVSGTDAERFLQGQLTNDLRQVTEDRAQPSGWCNPKGRLLASFQLLRRDQDYVLQLPAELLEPVLKRLRLFVLRSQVKLDQAGGRWPRIGIAGPDAPDLLVRSLGTPPEQDWGLARIGDLSLVRLPGGGLPRFEILGPAAPLANLWLRLAVDAQPGCWDDWALLDIRAGLATILPATVEAFVPQMVHLDQIGGVSFTKGCYSGQEVVARLHYLGKAKRGLFRARLVADRRPLAGDLLHDPAGATVGQVVDARPTAPDRHELLLVADIGAAEAGGLCLGNLGPALELLDLPGSTS